MIDFGPARAASGCGIMFQVIDIDGGFDIIAPGKDRLYLFNNLGIAQLMGD